MCWLLGVYFTGVLAGESVGRGLSVYCVYSAWGVSRAEPSAGVMYERIPQFSSVFIHSFIYFPFYLFDCLLVLFFYLLIHLFI